MNQREPDQETTRVAVADDAARGRAIAVASIVVSLATVLLFVWQAVGRGLL